MTSVTIGAEFTKRILTNPTSTVIRVKSGMESLKFLMVSTHYPPFHLGGDAVMVEYLANELANRGHEVHILYNPSVYELLRKSRNRKTPPSDREGVIRHEFRTRHPRYGLYSTLATGYCERAEESLVELCRKVGPDVVHWHNTKGFVGVPHSLKGKVSLYTAHDYYTVCPRSNLTRPDLSYCQSPGSCQLCLVRWRKPVQLWRIGRRRIVKLDEGLKVLSPSEYTANRLRIEGVKVHAVLRNFVPDPGVQSCKSPQERKKLVYVGMLEQHKGPRTLVEAFEQCSTIIGFDLVIVGDGTLRESIVASAKASRAADRIHIPGFVPREVLRSILCEAAALVIPSEWPENAPLVALEALAMGVPIIGSNQGGLPEILSSESGCRIFAAGNVEALKRALISTWDSRAELDSLGKRARRAYEDRFSPDIHIRAYLDIIGQVSRP